MKGLSNIFSSALRWQGFLLNFIDNYIERKYNGWARVIACPILCAFLGVIFK